MKLPPQNSGPALRYRPRFTIRSLMIAVAVAAAVLTPWSGWKGVWIPLVIATPFLAHLIATWLVYRGKRRNVAVAFLGHATVVSVIYAILSVRPSDHRVIAMCVGWLFVIAPTVASFGIAWSVLATQKSAVPRRSPPLAWLSVVALIVLPVFAPLTSWPLRLAFLAARPELETLADQIASGQTVSFPRWVGLFRFADSGVDSASGNVGLLIESRRAHGLGPHPAGCTPRLPLPNLGLRRERRPGRRLVVSGG
jgi:hypothetical protein